MAFVAFSPVGRGFLADEPLDPAAFEASDFRRAMPRFEPANWATNTRLLPAYQAIAAEVGCTPAQLALAWLLHQGENIIPIPGTTRVEHLLDNLGAVNVQLSAQTLQKLDALINQATVAGSRYNPQGNLDADTEQF